MRKCLGGVKSVKRVVKTEHQRVRLLSDKSVLEFLEILKFCQLFK